MKWGLGRGGCCFCHGYASYMNPTGSGLLAETLFQFRGTEHQWEDSCSGIEMEVLS